MKDYGLPTLNPKIQTKSKSDDDTMPSLNQIKNLRIKKNEFKAYLSKRYNPTIADKFLSHFDLKNQWTYKHFVNSMEIAIYQTEEFF